MNEVELKPGNAFVAPRRPWRRLHRSTYFFALFAAVVLFFLNVPGQYVWHVDLSSFTTRDPNYPLMERLEHGFPFAYLSRDVYSDFDFATGSNVNSAWWLTKDVRFVRPLALVADIAVAIVIGIFVVAGFEYRRRRRTRLFQVRISEMLIGTTLIASCCGYLLKTHRDYESEQTALKEALPPPGLYDNAIYLRGSSLGGPTWLRERMRDRFPPWFDRVTWVVTSDASTLASLAPCTQLRTVVFFGFRESCTGDQIACLAELARLEAAGFSECHPRPPSLPDDESSSEADSDREFARGLSALVELPRLTALDVTNSTFGDQSAEAISQFKHLRVLTAGETILTDKGMRHLSSLTRLETLVVGSYAMSDEGVAHLARLKRLKKIALYVGCTDASLIHIAELGEMRELHLGETKVTGPGLVHLKSLTKLERLILPDKIDRKSVKELRHHLPELKTSVDGVNFN